LARLVQRVQQVQALQEQLVQRDQQARSLQFQVRPVRQALQEVQDRSQQYLVQLVLQDLLDPQVQQDLKVLKVILEILDPQVRKAQQDLLAQQD